MTRESFQKRMYEIFEEAGVEVKEKYEIEADSLQYIMIISAIEEEFDLELPDEFLAYNGLQNPKEFVERVFELIDKRA